MTDSGDLPPVPEEFPAEWRTKDGTKITIEKDAFYELWPELKQDAGDGGDVFPIEFTREGGTNITITEDAWKELLEIVGGENTRSVPDGNSPNGELQDGSQLGEDAKTAGKISRVSSDCREPVNYCKCESQDAKAIRADEVYCGRTEKPVNDCNCVVHGKAEGSLVAAIEAIEMQEYEKAKNFIKEILEGESSSPSEDGCLGPDSSDRFDQTCQGEGGGEPPKPYGVVTDKIKCDCGVIPLLLDTGDMKCHGCGKIYDFKIKLEEKEK